LIEVNVSVTINASAARVWSVMGGFDNLPLWLAIIRSSQTSDGGRIRRLETTTGDVIVERLLDFCEADRRYTYALIEASAPVSGYVGAMSVRDDGDERSIVAWSSRFRPDDAGKRDELHSGYERIYQTGLDDLKTLIESGARNDYCLPITGEP